VVEGHLQMVSRSQRLLSLLNSCMWNGSAPTTASVGASGWLRGSPAHAQAGLVHVGGCIRVQGLFQVMRRGVVLHLVVHRVPCGSQQRHAAWQDRLDGCADVVPAPCACGQWPCRQLCRAAVPGHWRCRMMQRASSSGVCVGMTQHVLKHACWKPHHIISASLVPDACHRPTACQNGLAAVLPSCWKYRSLGVHSAVHIVSY
jgi:hypothetical protein